MTAAEHLTRAEFLLEKAKADGHEWDPMDTLTMTLQSIGHFLGAIAVELGVPPVKAGGDVSADNTSRGQ